jgi:putative DNA primase/helicase
LTAKWGKGIRNDIARLEGARFVSASEAGAGQTFDQAVVKQITGRDKVIARFLYQEFTEFTPEFKVFLGSNFMPKIVGMDEAFWNRVHVIPFPVRIPKREQDKNLERKLRKEFPGILTWAVNGCLAYQERGLQSPSNIRHALLDYKRDADPFNAYIDEKCWERKGASIPAREIFEAYETWCVDKKTLPETQNMFGRYLTDRGFELVSKNIGGEVTRLRKGIRLKRTKL